MKQKSTSLLVELCTQLAVCHAVHVSVHLCVTSGCRKHSVVVSPGLHPAQGCEEEEDYMSIRGKWHVMLSHASVAVPGRCLQNLTCPHLSAHQRIALCARPLRQAAEQAQVLGMANAAGHVQGWTQQGRQWVRLAILMRSEPENQKQCTMHV